MIPYSTKMVLDLINQDNNKSFTMDQLSFGPPVVNTDPTYPTNTKIAVTALDGVHTGTVTMYYDRLDFGRLFAALPMTFDRAYEHLSTHDVLGVINDRFGLHLETTDVIEAPLDLSGGLSKWQFLEADPGSYAYIGSFEMELYGNPSAPPGEGGYTANADLPRPLFDTPDPWNEYSVLVGGTQGRYYRWEDESLVMGGKLHDELRDHLTPVNSVVNPGSGLQRYSMLVDEYGDFSPYATIAMSAGLPAEHSIFSDYDFRFIVTAQIPGEAEPRVWNHDIRERITPNFFYNPNNFVDENNVTPPPYWNPTLMRYEFTITDTRPYASLESLVANGAGINPGDGWFFRVTPTAGPADGTTQMGSGYGDSYNEMTINTYGLTWDFQLSPDDGASGDAKFYFSNYTSGTGLQGLTAIIEVMPLAFRDIVLDDGNGQVGSWAGVAFMLDKREDHAAFGVSVDAYNLGIEFLDAEAPVDGELVPYGVINVKLEATDKSNAEVIPLEFEAEFTGSNEATVVKFPSNDVEAISASFVTGGSATYANNERVELFLRGCKAGGNFTSYGSGGEIPEQTGVDFQMNLNGESWFIDFGCHGDAANGDVIRANATLQLEIRSLLNLQTDPEEDDLIVRDATLVFNIIPPVGESLPRITCPAIGYDREVDHYQSVDNNVECRIDMVDIAAGFPNMPKAMYGGEFPLPLDSYRLILRRIEDDEVYSKITCLASARWTPS